MAVTVNGAAMAGALGRGLGVDRGWEEGPIRAPPRKAIETGKIATDLQHLIPGFPDLA